METVDNQLTVIDKSIEVFRGGSAILLSHQTRASKALKVAASILEIWEQAYALQDPEERRSALAAIDKRSNDFLANCGKALTEMQEGRKAVTQLMDAIKKMFTEEEGKLDAKKDGKPALIQQQRNKYAKFLHEEQERQRKESEAKAAKAKEELDIRTTIKNAISQCLLSYLAKRKNLITNRFHEITLDTFGEKSAALKTMPIGFPTDKLGEIVQYSRPFFSRHSDAEYLVIQGDVHEQYDFSAFHAEYTQQISDLKQSLLDKLPSKKQELEALASADENERIRLENERMNREAEEKRRLEKEADEARLKAEQETELAKASGTAQLLFDQVAETAVETPAPEIRSGFEITVTHPAGWVEVFQFWYQREGCKLKPEDMGKKSLNQMKTFAEGVAKKSGEKIDSKFLNYETAIKSVNRKA